MRVFEIILKILFLVFSVIIFLDEFTSIGLAIFFIIVMLALGLVLIFNKKASYNFVQKSRDLWIRRIEGIVLIIASILCYSVIGIPGL